ncbi:uncharacterized protein [Clytia hemisphaerica]|uniref:Cnidarian restricted protein n=1 Tax=Clytia hemisphaerica TaxID=252671 RepID=A0A7M6DP11_9CNID
MKLMNNSTFIVLSILLWQINGNPINNASTTESTAKPKDEETVTEEVWKKVVAVIGTLVIKGVLAILAYCKYKSTQEIATKLMKSGEVNYHIKHSWWNKWKICWSCCVFMSGLTCWTQKCCDQNNKCICCCKKGKRNSSSGTGNRPNDPLLMKQGPEKLVDISTSPKQNLQNDFKNNKRLNNVGINYFYDLLKKCNRITYRQFLERFNGFSRKFRRAHCYHFKNQKCWDVEHRDYKMLAGMGLEPILYYVVLDWNDLRLKFQGFQDSKLESIDVDPKEFFKLLFDNEHPPSQKSLDLEWESILNKYRRQNMCLTFMNFPSSESDSKDWGEKDHQLALEILEFVHTLQLRNANIVCRSNDTGTMPDFKSVWEVQKSNDSEKILLKLNKSDLKTFPKGKDVSSTQMLNQRTYFVAKDGTTKVEAPNLFKINDLNTLEVEIEIDSSKIPSNFENVRCRIYVGEEPLEGENANGLNSNQRPCLESPLLIVKSAPTQSTSHVAQPASNPRPTPPVKPSAPTDQPDAFVAPTLQSNYLLQDVFKKAAHKRELANFLEKGCRWYKVGQGVFTERNDQLEDMKNNISFIHNKKFLVKLKPKLPDLTWGVLQQSCVDLGLVELQHLNLRKDKALDTLSDLETDDIARALSHQNGWQLVYDTYEKWFDEHEKTEIEASHQYVYGRENPTNQLLELINQWNPDYTIRQFYNVCTGQSLRYNDVGKFIRQLCGEGKP